MAKKGSEAAGISATNCVDPARARNRQKSRGSTCAASLSRWNRNHALTGSVAATPGTGVSQPQSSETRPLMMLKKRS